jgi:hypothetical protein
MTSGHFPDVEKRLVQWVEDRKARGLPLNGPMIQKKGKEVARTLGRTDFNGSEGWLKRFKGRNGLSFRKWKSKVCYIVN